MPKLLAAIIILLALSLPGLAEPLAAGTIAEAKTFADGVSVELNDRMVSGRTIGSYWIIDDNRSCGIRVVSSLFPAPGTRVSLTGVLSTVDGERRVTPSGAESVGTTGEAPRRLGVRLSHLGGAAGNAHTPGVYGGTGANNFGLFSRAWGKITAAGSGYFYIDDGSGLLDGTNTGDTPNAGLRVLTALRNEGVGDFVAVTGAVTSFAGPLGRVRPAILPTTGDPNVGSIAGRVAGSNGTGISGAAISTTPGGYSATANSTGHFAIADVPVGVYNISASKSGYNSQLQNAKAVAYNQTTTVDFTLVLSITDVVTNGSFENGFSAGVGNGWTSFASSGYGPTFQDGNDRKKDGLHAQKIVMPQPSSEKFAGIYQRLVTVPGNQYTLTVWEQASIAEAYTGEHLVCKLGYDLNGGTSFTAPSVVWNEIDARKELWVSRTLTFAATSTYTTVYLQAWRKWASGGTGTVWFDLVTCTGPSGAQNGSISGTVRTPGGAGIAGATVSTGPGGYSTTTAANGTYLLNNIAAGGYSLIASKPGYSPQTLNVTVAGGQTVTADFTLPEATGSGVLTGTVIAPNGDGISGANVVVSPGGLSAVSGPSGVYAVVNIPAGQYSVTASRPGFQSHTYGTQAVNEGVQNKLNFTLPYSHSKIGFHIVIGARNGYGPFLQQTSSCGKPVAIIKCVDDMSPAVEAKSYSQATLTVGRYINCGSWNVENLGAWGGSAASVAAQVYPCLKALWLEHPEIDVWELCNEWDSDYAWQADYYIAMMDLAEPDGFRLALWSSSVGTPSEHVYPDVARACARAKRSGNHLLALHEYALYGEPALLQDQNTSLVTRYRQLHNYLKQHDADIPIIITECSQNGGYNYAGDTLFIQDFGWYDNEVRKDSYVLGVTAWTLGNWANANCMSGLDDMANYICTH